MDQLTFADEAYFTDCINDLRTLMTPVVVKRCISIRRDDAYPDNPPKLEYRLIPASADIREVALNEVFQSGGVLAVGDNVIWCQFQLRGPQDIISRKDDPNSIADVIVLHNAEWTIQGVPLIGRLRDPQIVGCQAYIRRRRGGSLYVGDEAFDDKL